MIKKKTTGIKKARKVSKKTLASAKKEQNSDLKMELYTKVNGKATSDMGMVYKNGLMVQSMRGTGKTTRPMVKEYFGTFMEINTKDGGNGIKLTVMENTLTVMELLTKVTGKMTSNMAKV